MSFDPQANATSIILTTTGQPANTVGANGQWAVDFTAKNAYLKTSGAWGSAVSFAGTNGTNGTAGTNGTNGTNGAAGTPGNLFNILSKTASYTVISGDFSGNTPLILADATAGSFTITLDASLLFTSGTPGTSKTIIVKQVDTSGNTVTLAAASGQTIDGAASQVLQSVVVGITSNTNQISRTVVAKSATALAII